MLQEWGFGLQAAFPGESCCVKLVDLQCRQQWCADRACAPASLVLQCPFEVEKQSLIILTGGGQGSGRVERPVTCPRSSCKLIFRLTKISHKTEPPPHTKKPATKLRRKKDQPQNRKQQQNTQPQNFAE